MIYVVMGVSGCGKSTVGQMLAEQLNVAFYDADDFHPKANVAKMTAGMPLNDEDRWPWLQSLADNMAQWQRDGGAVLACSALKQSYRDLLASVDSQVVQFIYLQGSFATLLARLKGRKGHFMQADLLQSQLDTLEEPASAITVSIDQPVDELVSDILKAL
ncbi:gluconate kinase [Saccharobesus litoralis]|uniref:Gluconokinase n=1 Tax=Saccharobesus litoralis TaxID=2172099 RepID=A0A2S0VPH4_9ALTE|nr:gluconokinase [Saccharobesus litoralis]AWB66099.1 gluconate kinase [Saccharobesus litoralis]